MGFLLGLLCGLLVALSGCWVLYLGWELIDKARERLRKHDKRDRD